MVISSSPPHEKKKHTHKKENKEGKEKNEENNVTWSKYWKGIEYQK